MRRWTRARAITVAVGVVGLVVVIAAVSALRAEAHADATERIDKAARRALDQIDRRMAAYSESIYGARGLFTTDRPDRRTFRSFAEALELDDRYPGIQVLGFASHVDLDDMDAYVETSAADAVLAGYPEFAPYPTTEGDERVVIDRIHPVAGNEAAVGLDFLSEPNRRHAVETTRDTGAYAATAPITLVQETGSQSGFLTMVAVYRPGAPLETVQDRRDAFLGVAYAAFRMGDLVGGVLGDASAGSIEVHDVGPVSQPATVPTADNLTYSDSGASRADAGSLTAVDRLLELHVGGRRWAILYSHADDGLTSLETTGPPLLGLLGALAVAACCRFVHTTLDDRERAVELARRMTEDLQRSEAELARSNLELERFAYIASHDLQEPLRTVANFVGLLERRYGEQLDEEGRGLIGHAVEGSRRMSTLIEKLLGYSRAGRDDVAIPVDLDELWRSTIDSLGAAIEASGARTLVDPLPIVIGDPAQLQQVFLNLVGNSLKYRRPEVPPIIRARAEVVDGWAEISVSDNGIGIDPAHHDEVFQMFKRLHTREEYPGSGMGLAIAKKVVEAAGGSMRIVSAVGEGATFVIRLPAAGPVTTHATESPSAPVTNDLTTPLSSDRGRSTVEMR